MVKISIKDASEIDSLLSADAYKSLSGRLILNEDFSEISRLTILWALFIFVMCTIKINEEVSNEPMFFPGFDKLVHSGFFFLLIVLWCNGIIRKQSNRLLPYKTAAIVTIACILFGGLIEVLQANGFYLAQRRMERFVC